MRECGELVLFVWHDQHDVHVDYTLDVDVLCRLSWQCPVNTVAQRPDAGSRGPARAVDAEQQRAVRGDV